MFEAATWKTLLGVVGVLALLGIPVLVWIRRRSMRRGRGSSHSWGGLLEGGSTSNPDDDWEDASSRFIDDYIPEIDEGQQETAGHGGVRETTGSSPDSLDHVSEGVRIIEEGSREVVPQNKVLPAESEAPPVDKKEPVSSVEKASADEAGAPWWEGLPAPQDVEHPRGSDESPAEALNEPPGSQTRVDRDTRFEDVIADEEILGAAEASVGVDAPMRMRIPAVSEVREDAVPGDEALDEDEKGEVSRLTRENEGAAVTHVEPVREEREDVADEVAEIAPESSPEPRFEETGKEPLPSRPEGPVLTDDKPEEASPVSQDLETETAPQTPQSEEESAPAVAPEEDVISLIQRERADEEDFSQSAALDEASGVMEDAEELDFPADEDAEQLTPDTALPPAASNEVPANTPSELIRELVSDICPEDLLLAENLDQKLPSWTPGVVNAAGIDLSQRARARQMPSAEEYLRLAILEIILRRNDDATVHLKESLRRTSRLAPVLNALAVASYQREKVDPAISYSREAFREAGRDVTVQAGIARNMGFFYQRKGDDEKAADSYEQALGYIGQHGEIKQLSSLRMRAGRLFRRLGNREKAREHLSEAAHLFHRLGDRRNEARAHTALASVLTETREYEAAQVSLDEALHICQKIGDKSGEALVYSQMGVSFAAQEQFTRALRYYENALRLNRELENRKGEAANLSGMGNIHYARGDLPEAREAYEAALDISRDQGNLLAQGVALGSLGRVHFESRDWEASRERLVEARRIFQDLGAADALDSVMEMLRELEKRVDA